MNASCKLGYLPFHVLASFESLEPQLVPAVLSAPSSLHTQILAEHWMAEVNSLRTLVFLIVDPTAFIEIIMEYYQTKLSILKRELNMTWTSVQYFVGLGKCILDYLTSYIEHEPKAFQQLEKLACIVKDLKKVVKECSVVCDLFLLKPNETHTEINAENDDTSTKEARIMKRLKLLHSLLNKVSNEISDKDMSVSEDTRERLASESDSQSQDSCENSDKESTLANSEKSPHSSVKHKGVMKIFDKFKAVFKTEMAPLSNENVNEKESMVMENVGSGNKNTLNKTYIRTSFARVAPKHLSKLSSLMFSPSSHDVQSRAKRLEIALKNKSSFHDQSFCFSISNECLNNPADEFMLADISMQDVLLNSGRTLLNEHTPKYRSSFYGNQIRSARRHGNSLRKKLLINRVENHNAVQKPIENASYSHRIEVKNYDSGLLPISSYNVLNGSLDLQITEILEQLTALSDTISLMKIDLTEDKILIEDFDDITKSTSQLNTDDHKIHDITNVKPNILTLKINRNELDSPKNVWNIRVMPDKENTPLSSAAAEPITPSEATNANSLVDCGIDVSFGSNVPTPERMNDLNQLELKLANLKQFWND